MAAGYPAGKLVFKQAGYPKNAAGPFQADSRNIRFPAFRLSGYQAKTVFGASLNFTAERNFMKLFARMMRMSRKVINSKRYQQKILQNI